MKSALIRFGVTLMLALLPLVPARGTVLLFENTNGFNLTTSIPVTYGDRVVTSPQGGFQYSLAGGPTPNVVVDFKDIGGWPSGFGDLKNLIYPITFRVGEIRFEADPGFEVVLQSVDLAGWLYSNRVVRALQVLDAGGTTLYSQENFTVLGASTTHSSIAFPATVQSRVLTLRIDTSNLGIQSDSVGLDNLRFAQTPVPLYVDVALYPGLSIFGTVGKSYRVEFSERLQPAGWQPLATVVLTNNPTRFVDFEARGTASRYYRAVETP